MAIEVDGKIYRNLPEQVEENANQIEDLKTLFSTLGTVMVYKGSVATYDDLPTEDNKIGDVWNVLDTGSNYAWDGEEWDEIGSTVDLSNLVTLDTEQVITGQKKISSSLLPSSDNACSLGASNIRFANVFAGNIANNYSSLWLTSSTDINITVGANNSLKPSRNNFADLGNNTFFWKDLYLSGNLTDGTNSVTVAQLASASPKTLDSSAVISSWTTTTLVTGFYKNEASLSTVAYNVLKDAKSIFIKMSDNSIHPATFDYNYYKIKVIGDVDFSGGSITEVEIYYQ